MARFRSPQNEVAIANGHRLRRGAAERAEVYAVAYRRKIDRAIGLIREGAATSVACRVAGLPGAINKEIVKERCDRLGIARRHNPSVPDWRERCTTIPY